MHFAVGQHFVAVVMHFVAERKVIKFPQNQKNQERQNDPKNGKKMVDELKDGD